MLVEWVDAFDMPDRWVCVEDICDESTVVFSVGWLVEPSPVDGYMTLATSRFDDIFGGGIHIPLSCVVDVKKLREK